MVVFDICEEMVVEVIEKGVDLIIVKYVLIFCFIKDLVVSCL